MRINTARLCSSSHLSVSSRVTRHPFPPPTPPNPTLPPPTPPPTHTLATPLLYRLLFVMFARYTKIYGQKTNNSNNNAVHSIYPQFFVLLFLSLLPPPPPPPPPPPSISSPFSVTVLFHFSFTSHNINYIIPITRHCHVNNLPSTEQAVKNQPKQVFFFHLFDCLSVV